MTETAAPLNGFLILIFFLICPAAIKSKNRIKSKSRKRAAHPVTLAPRLRLASLRVIRRLFGPISSYFFTDLGDAKHGADLRESGLDYREHTKTTNRTLNTRLVGAGLCGNAAKARTELDWQPNWTLPTTIGDMVQAEIEGWSELECRAPGA